LIGDKSDWSSLGEAVSKTIACRRSHSEAFSLSEIETSFLSAMLKIIAEANNYIKKYQLPRVQRFRTLFYRNIGQFGTYLFIVKNEIIFVKQAK
jgi:hypothetical protein